MSKSVALLIGGTARIAEASFDRHDPVTGALASQASAAALPDLSKRGRNERRGMLMKAAAALEGRAADFVEATMAEIGATEGWASFNLMLAAGIDSFAELRWVTVETQPGQFPI